MQESNIKIFLKKIWPTTYRIINTSFYFIISVIRGIISIAFKQIKQ